MKNDKIENWIWLPSEKQNSTTSSNFCVAQFSKSFDFNNPIEKIDIKTSGDTFFRLFVNGKQQVVGQVAVGGDFLSFPPQSKKIEISFPPQYYATEVTIRDDEQFDSGRVDFVSIVRSTAIHFCECSRGQGGFFLTAYVTFKDGTTTIVATDEDWDAEQIYLQRIFKFLIEHNAK